MLQTLCDRVGRVFAPLGENRILLEEFPFDFVFAQRFHNHWWKVVRHIHHVSTAKQAAVWGLDKNLVPAWLQDQRYDKRLRHVTRRDLLSIYPGDFLVLALRLNQLVPCLVRVLQPLPFDFLDKCDSKVGHRLILLRGVVVFEAILHVLVHLFFESGHPVTLQRQEV